MKESIRIKNMGPLRDVYIEDIRPMTILIGESGSGKSLLMKTLILFRYIYKMLNIRWYLKNSNVNKSRFKLTIGNLLSPELKHYFKDNKQLEVEYTVEINGNKHSVAFRNGSIDRNTTDKAISNEDLIFLKESWISEMRNIIPDWDSFTHNIKKRNLNYYFQETLNDFLDASDKLKNIPLSYLGLSLDIEKKGEAKKYYIKPIDDSYPQIEWKYASSGIQTSSSIPTIVDYFANSFSFKEAIGRSIISYLYETDTLRLYKPELEPMDMKRMVHIHIEEPELNLYPTAQCLLMDSITKEAFMSVAADRELRLIIATHSPYIINYLNVLINRKGSNQAKIDKANLAVYRIYDGMLQNLIATDDEGRIFVDTQDLTEQMENIMSEYEFLTNHQ